MGDFLVGLIMGAILTLAIISGLNGNTIDIGKEALERGYVEYQIIDPKTGERALLWKQCK